MGNSTLIPFKQADALANAVATAWLDEIGSAKMEGRAFCVALSGGRIAGPLFAEFSRQAKVRASSLGQVHFFWADERCVPSDDAGSNFRVAHELLLCPLGIIEDRIHRIQGEQPPDAAAREAEAELRRIAPPGADGQPVLDLILLGMGEDGHVASLFPGEPAAVAANPAVYRAVTATKPPPHRVTLGYGVLAVAREVWVLISGDEKEGALRESLRPEGRTPLARMLRSRTRTRIFSDRGGDSQTPAT
jgi:6-phosphogluconolactonase